MRNIERQLRQSWKLEGELALLAILRLDKGRSLFLVLFCMESKETVAIAATAVDLRQAFFTFS